MATQIDGFRRFAPSSFLIFAMALVLSASAASLVVVYRTGERIISERERAEALDERDLLEEVDQEQGLNPVASAVARRTRFASSGEHYGLFTSAGEPLAGDIAGFQPEFRGADWRVVHLTRPASLTLHVEGAVLPDGAVLVVGRSLANLRKFERSILYGFVAAVAIVAVAALAAGLVLNFLILQRVDAIAATAERIAGGDLSARTTIADRRDPFGRVGASLNAMLERIEELLTGMRTVTDSVAHDLRSPLTRMKGALARALEPGATEGQRLDAIDAAHDEADRALATLSALLDIARAETGLSRDMMQMVDVAALVEELVDFFTPVIEDADQRLEMVLPPVPVVVRAHPALLRQAIGNLLHNAAHYAGAGAVVQVSVKESHGGDAGQGSGGTVRLTVADSGSGVPEDQRGRVQQRFVRLDPARRVGGSGLGLAIVAACAKLHGGVLRLEDNAPGLRAVLEIKSE